MNTLLKVLLAATALVPVATAASAQDGPDDGPRWRGRGGGAAAAKIDVEAGPRGMDAPRPEFRRAQPDAGPRPDRGGPDPRVQADVRGGGEARGWRGRDDGPGRPDRGPNAGWGERRGQPPEANTAVNRPGGPDWNNPRSRTGDRAGWNGQRFGGDDARYAGRGPDGRRFDDGPRERDGRADWNRDRPDVRVERGGWDRSRGDWDRSREGWDRGRGTDRGAWNRTWRNDRRYDWNGYRATNRSAYRLPRYYAPGGWSYGYRRFSIGATLGGPLWGENYWIDDPWSFRLPEAYGPYRWVRYYDDALLVDVRTGRVVDLVYGIFW